MYKRILEDIIPPYFFKGKVIILTGARQTGKTSLVRNLIDREAAGQETRVFNCDNLTDRELLVGKDIEYLSTLIGHARFIFIDEGQKVSGIGETLKLLVDRYQTSKQVILTGSSGINLLTSTQEPLTGRKLLFHLYPLSLEEILMAEKDPLKLRKELPERIVFGSYPEVVQERDQAYKTKLLEELCSSYLYKDILEFQRIRDPEVLNKLLRALALQTGAEVSYHELSNLLGLDKNTVERYVDLLEKNFIIIRLPPYTSNKRKELSKKRKIYFLDNGIRNTLVMNMNMPDIRTDTGALWENFLIVERMKYRFYHGIRANQHFWRTYQGAEVDLVEEREGKLWGYEMKWGDQRSKVPKGWADIPHSEWTLINRKKLEGFVY